MSWNSEEITEYVRELRQEFVLPATVQDLLDSGDIDEDDAIDPDMSGKIRDMLESSDIERAAVEEGYEEDWFRPEGLRQLTPEEQELWDELEDFVDELLRHLFFRNNGTLIEDSEFAQHAEEEGSLYIDQTTDAWPFRHIDWEAAGLELQQDYTCFEFRGTTYWYRE